MWWWRAVDQALEEGLVRVLDAMPVLAACAWSCVRVVAPTVTMPMLWLVRRSVATLGGAQRRRASFGAVPTGQATFHVASSSSSSSSSSPSPTSIGAVVTNAVRNVVANVIDAALAPPPPFASLVDDDDKSQLLGRRRRPRARHAVLPLSVHRRVLIVGDVHGCLDELLALLRKVGMETRECGDIILVGDLLAKGPKSRQVLEWAMQRGAYCVRGNHDHWVLTCADVLRAYDPTNADHVAIRKKIDEAARTASAAEPEHVQIARQLSPEQLAWLSDAPLTLRLPEHQIIIVHAGVLPERPLEEHQPFDLMNMRNVLPSGEASKKRSEGVAWIETWKGPETIVFGHDAARGLQRHANGLAFGLDSGCCYGKSLTGLLLPDRKLVHVDAECVYTPPTASD